MSSSFESLPVEVFETIIQKTDLIDIWRLQQCNSALEITLDPYIIAEPHGVHKLMAWGCLRGNIWAIKKALSLGADISTVEVAWRPNSVLCSTLGLAARRKHHDTFEFLLKSGAQPDVTVHTSQSTTFKRHLFAPEFPRFVQLCQNHGVKDSIPNIQANLDEALVEAVKMNLKLEICQSWMDLGANPTGQVGKSWNPETALSLAISLGSITLAKAMISRGCHLDLPIQSQLPIAYPPKQQMEPWKYIPMIAAARHLALKGKTDMIELLLESGADINVKCRAWFEDWTDHLKYTERIITPLSTYLLNVDFDVEWKHSPSRMVGWFLNKGANIRSTDPTHLDLLDLWKHFKGGRCLLNNEIFTIIKLFLENGAAKGKVPQWLAGQGLDSSKQFPFDNPITLEQQAVGIERWSIIIDMLLKDDNFEGGLTEHLDTLLMELLGYIMDCLFRWNHDAPDPCTPELETKFYDISHPIMIQKLLERGASINATTLRLHGKAVLTVVSSKWGNKNRYPWPSRLKQFQQKQQRSLVSMLANLGAASVFLQEGQSSKLKHQGHGVYMLWRCALQGEVSDEERLLWNPTAGALVDIPDRLDSQEREELRRQRKDAEKVFDCQIALRSGK
ncbi:hypothetical protein CDV31_001324 [Fusarium ambrosium]|uniref:Uncharacterized protein n=1 Tax=Fusarium ambrosium TaxID=131363 RepID=A0A428V088_9HYPO|nr:hypothetical protein CDV31_001324 [Fusarium ambrosium]